MSVRTKFLCRECASRPKAIGCIYCGGAGHLIREVWDTEDFMRHMSRIGTERGRQNEQDKWTGRFTGKIKRAPEKLDMSHAAREARLRLKEN